MPKALLGCIALSLCMASISASAGAILASSGDFAKVDSVVLPRATGAGSVGGILGGDAISIYEQAMSLIARTQVGAAFMPPTVPEPPTTALLGAAFAASVFFRMRRRGK
jgi:hypothetical protein